MESVSQLTPQQVAEWQDPDRHPWASHPDICRRYCGGMICPKAVDISESGGDAFTGARCERAVGYGSGVVDGSGEPLDVESQCGAEVLETSSVLSGMENVDPDYKWLVEQTEGEEE